MSKKEIRRNIFDRRMKIFLHIVFWAFMFLSPLQYMRGTGVTALQYVMNCMPALLLMIVFYANFKWLTYRYFVPGKHRYYLMINFVMIVGFALFLYYWSDFTRQQFRLPGPPPFHIPDTLDDILSFIRDVINFTIFATVATSLALSQRWYWADSALKAAEAARVKAELNNLRSQINPHFLLNTLNNIYALTAIDAMRAQDAIQQLSKLLRHMLYDNQEQLVSLNDEVQFLQNYVNLMKIRLSSNVDVRFDYEPGNHPPKVSPLIAVSLIENAFKHGVSPTEPSFIHIRIAVEDTHVTVDIQNSNHPKSDNDRSGHGIGLQQVQNRLDLSYAGHYKWHHGVSDDGKVYSSIITIETKA